MTLTLEIPEEQQRLSPDGFENLLEEYVVALYKEGVVSAGRAAELLKTDRWTIERVLSRHEAWALDEEEIRKDIETGRRMAEEWKAREDAA